MLQLLRYYWFALKFPEARDFIDMGYGIVARAGRSAKFWAKHIESCKEFERNLTFGDSLAVLGAGRLLDFDSELCRRFKRVDLYDADPAVARSWHKFGRAAPCKLGAYITDLTGAMEPWTNELKQLLISEGSSLYKVRDFLLDLKIESPPILTEIKEPYDAVLSLNLLSQIPIYWRDRIIDLLARHLDCRPSADGKFSEELDRAIEASMAELQSAHLLQLSQSRAREIILISDYEIYYYRKDLAAWQVETALFGGAAKLLLDGYFAKKQSSWLWHIAPQGIEQSEYGVLHAVRAVHYTANDREPRKSEIS